MSTPINILLAQINPIVGDLDYNQNKICEVWEKTPSETDLIIFPEMVLCGYPPEDLVLKPFFMRKIEESVNSLLEFSKAQGSAALISCPWIIEEKIYNAVHLIENGEIKATRCKHHLPNYGVFDEIRVFKPGSMPKAISFRGHKLGVMICEDMWAKDISAHLKSQGAELLITLNASPFEIDKTHKRITHAKARVDETNLPLLYVNQVGGQDELVFDGASFVMNEIGEIVHELKPFEEDTLSINCHPGMLQDNKNKKGNKNEEYDNKTIYQALTLGLKDYVEKNNFPGVLIGLSGGIDSALAAVIAVEALGADRVHCVMMPSKYTSLDSLEDARRLSDNLGIKLDNISIEEPVTALNTLLAPYIPDNAPGIVAENIQPRSRGLILMTLSNANNYMVLSTGNKSEMAVGYATLYGDMCGGFNPLKDLYKMQVYELSNWINREHEIIPVRIITKAPTAELKDDQCDQDSLPPYEELDDILMCLIEKDMGIHSIEKRGHARETISHVWSMLDRAEYKRRQACPGVKITSRAFGKDRRYPITNHFLNIVEKS